MTCKNCLHYEVCLAVFSSKGMYLGDDAEKMKCFKNKADFAEIKHGKWQLHPDGSGTCSVCGKHQVCIWDLDNWQNFCGHCGADMRGEISNVE